MFLRDRKGKVIPYRKAEDRKGAGTNSGEAGMTKLEAGSEAEQRVQEGV